MGFDCSLLGQTPIVTRVLHREEPLESVLKACSGEIFTWELTKDPMLTPLALRLSNIWPSVSADGGALRLYFLVRNPFDCVRSFIEHLMLNLDISPEDKDGQRFTLDNMPQASRFTRGKQLYMDVTRDGLRYTGYVDAAVQRWALSVDVYLRCPSRFVLVRYEDFKDDPVLATESLLQRLGLGDFWDGSVAQRERVKEAAAMQYQPKGKAKGSYEDIFGISLFERIHAAVASRAQLLGYSHLLHRNVSAHTWLPPDAGPTWPREPIDLPAPPTTEDCRG
eukprot:gnl/TRDRNA2_/TRDRNA2_161592_c0_seq1.p1 gnl/TRDRNA2_/TRDRNA2_161592_c0~~gnl/TRDRNA2_/TRDRNA2_161592_c0_seq1.p1  ORF type:complete len:279 (-),score=48.76 gnl/TRDRNA2_/TRDRNA2_161592_c0_seq1:183-1019(-)